MIINQDSLRHHIYKCLHHLIEGSVGYLSVVLHNRVSKAGLPYYTGNIGIFTLKLGYNMPR